MCSEELPLYLPSLDHQHASLSGQLQVLREERRHVFGISFSDQWSGTQQQTHDSVVPRAPETQLQFATRSLCFKRSARAQLASATIATIIIHGRDSKKNLTSNAWINSHLTTPQSLSHDCVHEKEEVTPNHILCRVNVGDVF